ncbi:hypothetical protein TrVFT333_002609 [Trichoderma virens FT-333]|nr:hypothetical protein TrVFT333_002609 [Trichoderma virens FT-333]
MNSTTLTCPVSGNPDLYGLGIRLGIYIQMLTIQLYGLASAITTTDDSVTQGNVLFAFATGIVLILLLREAINIQPVEAFFVLALLLAELGIQRVAYWKNMKTALLYTVSLGGIIVLFAWFWWHGIDTLPRACHDDKAFFFAKVSLWHWFRTLHKVASVIAIISGAVSFTFYLCAMILFTFVPNANFVGRFKDKTGGLSKESSNPLGFGPVDLLLEIGVIVYVEMALKWNNISGVHSLATPGQFTPFIVAIAQFLGLFCEVGKGLLSLSADEDSLPSSNLGALQEAIDDEVQRKMPETLCTAELLGIFEDVLHDSTNQLNTRLDSIQRGDESRMTDITRTSADVQCTLFEPYVSRRRILVDKAIGQVRGVVAEHANIRERT